MTKKFAGNPYAGIGKTKVKKPKLLEKGDVIILTEEHTVYIDGTSTTTKLVDEYAHMRGEYVVLATNLKGGGTGHSKHDVYPDGHHVSCQSKNGKHKVNFYQTGSFTAMIEDIKPIGKVKIKVTFEDT